MEKFFILALAFIAICSPILTLFALIEGAKVSFMLLIITLIELAILLIVLMDKLLVRTLTNKDQDRKKKIQKVVNILIIIVAVCLLPGAWSISEEGKESHTRNYSYDSEYKGNVSSYSYSSDTGNKKEDSGYKKCQYHDCERILVDETDSYCYYHVCKKMGCNSVRYKETEYCEIHTGEQKQQKSYSSNRSSSSKKAEDEYGVNDYSGADDFYEDNYDDFEGYEDAEDYYDEYAD